MVSVLITFQWLKVYTKHNQKSVLPNYVNASYDEALTDAETNKFRMVVLDSIYIVGAQGHMVISQDPVAGSEVKENRTIYVTITKQSADQVAFGRLPVFYGKNFDRKRRELFQSFQIEAKIVSRRYDSGEPNHILEVRYNGEKIADANMRREDVLIEKGGTLEFVVSEAIGGELQIPDLTCLTFGEAKFILSSSSIELGEVITDGTTGIVDGAFITGQVPDPEEGTMRMGESVRLSLSRDKPMDCIEEN